MATLGFSTQWPKHMGGKPTNFVDKIWHSLPDEIFKPTTGWLSHKAKCVRQLGADSSNTLFPEDLASTPKKHTIRADEKNLWVPGRKIHMVVFNRSKNRFQFAPTLEVKAVQFIRILWDYDEELEMNTPCLYTGEKPDYSDLMPWHYPTYGEKEMKQLALNDGFDSIKHFFQWFNSDFEGKIIHWADLKY
jgi:hypothetical protein